MYLVRLLGLPIEQRVDKFIEIIEHHKDSFKNEKSLNDFTLVYPEWALGFAYVEDLKKAIAEMKPQ